MNVIYDDFKTYNDYKNKCIVENYIRHTYFNTVIEAFNTLEDAEDFMNTEELWDDATLLGVDRNGRAFYPSF